MDSQGCWILRSDRIVDMALGTNRDYKTADRRARKNIARHAELMNEIMKIGYDRERSSRFALDVIEGKTTVEQIVKDRADEQRRLMIAVFGEGDTQ